MHDRISHAGQMSRLTSHSQWILLILAAANGGFLYFTPGLAESGYAWAIKPSINAAFMGAGYLAGLLASVLGLYYARRWRSVRALVLPFFGLGVVMTLATVMHEDRFRWGYWLTWLWAAVYVAIPPIAAFLYRREERMPRGSVDQDMGLDSMRAFASLLGAILLTLAALLFFAPKVIAAVWPWTITPLIARVFAAWHVLMGGVLLWSAFGARRFHELPIPFLTVFVWSLLLGALPFFHGPSLTHASATVAFVLLQLVLAVFSGSVALRAIRAMRYSGQAL
ncbi:MAG TPA: hypothetical protein VFG30_44005 [Polyangiales bacterium]|nr:hypothetical protein [Polyangiales bacterium]